MKKYYIASIFILIGMGILFSGCYKDKGNYTYHDLNKISIQTFDSTITIYQFDTLRIEPEVTQEFPKEGGLKYKWYGYYTGQPRVYETTLSHEKNLEAQIGFTPHNSRDYDLIFEVTDTTTGIKAFHHYKMKVTSQLSSGWLVLDQDESNSDLSLIAPSGDVFRNIFSAANPDSSLPLNTNVVASIHTTWGDFNYVFYKNGGYLLDRTSIEVITDYSNLFFTAPEILRPQAVYYFSGGFSALLVNNGYVYNRSFIYGASHYGSRYAGDYKAAPYVVNGGFFDAFFFDKKNERFVNVGTYGTEISTFPGDPNAAFDMNHVPKELLTLIPGYSQYDLALLKNKNDDSTFLYTIDLGFGATVNALDSQVVNNSPNINNATGYAASSSVALLYYTFGNKVYVYDIPADKARVVYEFSNNENITAFKMSGNSLVVATYDGNEGAVYYLDLASTGDIKNNQYTKKFTEFGQIKDLTYKNN